MEIVSKKSMVVLVAGKSVDCVKRPVKSCKT